jgi:UDP-glucose:(heptosyl)LPS alpha-1,3-glucosyltransferase
MRLLLTIPHFDAAEGGAEGFAVTVCRELARRGHAVRVLAQTGRPGPNVDLVLGDLADAPRHVAEFPADLHVDWGLHVPADLHRLGGGVHREYMRMMQEARSPLMRAVRAFVDEFRGKHRQARREEDRLFARSNAHFLANSEFVARQVRAVSDVPEGHVHVLLNGVDTTRFSADRLAGLRATKRAELGLASDDVAFVLSAHNLRMKNFALLARVFAGLHATCPQAKLVVMGKRRPAVAAQWLVYAGATRQPEAVYAAMDALVHPTLFDACANVVIEAMASGLPVLTSDRNGSAELVTEGESGQILPVVGDRARIDALWEQAILGLATDAGKRADWGRAGRAIAEKQSIVNYADQLAPLLIRLAEQKRQRSAAGGS